MSLEFSLLGFLQYHSMTGYDLKKMLDESTQFFWHAELSQIYPVLKRLEQKGWITSTSHPQEGKPDKKVYSITPAGRTELHTWLSSPMDEIPAIKNQVLLKLFFSGSLSRMEISAQLRCQLEMQRALLKRFQQETRAKIKSVPAKDIAPQNVMMWEIVRRYGEAQAAMTVHWLEESLAIVEQSADR